MEKANKVLVIAFDGLDYKLIKDYECENIMQKEFGRVDNFSGVIRRSTSELFACFITGKTWEEHGVISGKHWDNERIVKLELMFDKLGKLNRLKSLRFKIYEMMGSRFIIPIHKHLKIDTIFDRIENSKALSVPSYNTSPLLQSGAYFLPLQTNSGVEGVKRIVDMEFEYVKDELKEEIKNKYDFLMAHFHKPDAYQHLYIDREQDSEKIKQLYIEMDQLAGDILKMSEDYDLIIFMSDHGLEDKNRKEHNKNAFYSSNIELGLKGPHITDFYDLLLEFIGKKTNNTKIRNQKGEEVETDKIKERLKDLGYM